MEYIAVLIGEGSDADEIKERKKFWLDKIKDLEV
jgi:hypothetical protein